MSAFLVEEIQELALQYFNLHLQLKALPGDVDLNFYAKDQNNKEYILKIAAANSDLGNLEMQTQLLLHISTQQTETPTPQVIPNQAGKYITFLPQKDASTRYLRLLTWLPGRMWANTNPHTTELLYNLGKVCGQFNQALSNFQHPSAKRPNFQWDNVNVSWTTAHYHLFKTAEQKQLAHYFYQLHLDTVTPKSDQLRKSIIHNDFNDYNIVVNADGNAVSGIIDFGDATYTYTINDLAIALSYAMMDKADPIATALSVIKGFHEQFQLNEIEIEVLFSLIATRLLISVTSAAINFEKDPTNEYHQISARAAWDLLAKLRNIHPSFAYYSFRSACGWKAVPIEEKLINWLQKEQVNFAPILGKTIAKEDYTVLDLSVGSLEMGNTDILEDAHQLHKQISRLLEDQGVNYGIGRYNEVRSIYTTDNYLVKGNEGPEWRTIHLGIDIFAEANTPIYAPLEGKVHSFQNNDLDRDYGPTIILEHEFTSEKTGEKHSFYTLYGHLSLASIESLEVGQVIQKGEAFAWMGDMPINGNWSPHLHFQIITDLMGKEGDFPGVAFPKQRSIWTSICPDPNLILGFNHPKLATQKDQSNHILNYRKKHLGRSLSLSYAKPLHIQRAYKQYLYDAAGRRYLDTVNNVPHVGHQHPKVVEAAKAQLNILNTNTRYLHENIIQFAEELCATLPDQLSVCHFVNSGSEANELALRMARTVTGQRDMIVAEVGYHGNTNACIDLSSYKFDGKGGKGAPDWVHVVPMPDPYRGIHQGEHTGTIYANYVKQYIQNLQAIGKGIAGFLFESILSCGGQIVPPKDFFKEAYRAVRTAGGVCIMDEVQVGFGRVGKHFWGFELFDVVPDIVVMGKPIGNGHPLGAVVTTPEIADAFANGMEYFNTFGGNPVSCAIGKTVLEVIREEGLQENALEVGEYLKKGLRSLQQQFPIIGDVRGEGLFLGFELVKDLSLKIPAPEQTTYLANRTRLLGLLNSTDGRDHNVIKIKPPLCFSKANADFFLETIEGVLKEDKMRI